MLVTYPAHTSTNGIEEKGVIRLTLITLRTTKHTSAVRLPEGNTVITEVITILPS